MSREDENIVICLSYWLLLNCSQKKKLIKLCKKQHKFIYLKENKKKLKDSNFTIQFNESLVFLLVNINHIQHFKMTA